MILSWLRNIFEGSRSERLSAAAPGQSGRVYDVSVSFDETTIRFDATGRPRQEIKWASIERVSIKSICGETDLIWVISTREAKAALSLPMGAEGEAELVRTMQARLQGFDNMAVIEAMSNAGDAEFQVWPPLGVATS